MSSEPKGVTFWGTALDDLREFPDEARRTAGYQIDQVQRGLEPSDWKSKARYAAVLEDLKEIDK